MAEPRPSRDRRPDNPLSARAVGRLPGRLSGLWPARSSGVRRGEGRVLPFAVVSAVVLLCAATAGAGLASVTAVAEQDLLLASEARIASILADAGRAEALVAQLADPRVNPAWLPGMRDELAAAGRRMGDDVAGLENAHPGSSRREGPFDLA